MRAVVQRVHGAAITIDRAETRRIGRGLVVFLGVMRGDAPAQAEFLAQKIRELRIFPDGEGKMNLSLEDVGGDLLVVSNFTLGTDCKKGRRPSFDKAAKPDDAIPLYQRFVALQRERIPHVETGEFGAHMDVTVENDGPVTILLDTEIIGK